MQQVRFRAMGCAVLAAIDSELPAARRALDGLPARIEAWERRLSRFRPQSELMRLNAAGGRAFPVSRDLWEVVDAALKAAEASAGLVHPTLLDALEAAGYDRSFELIREQPVASAPTQQHRSAALAPHQAIQRDPRTRSLRLIAGARLDLGGIAKGWAADQAVRELAEYGPALVDIGGDIALSGLMADQQGWPIGVTDPRDPQETVALLIVPQGGVATSGRDYRRWQQDGIWQHHILDPRSGQPARTDLLSVTVVAPSAVEAEAAAKAIFILGLNAGAAWLHARPTLAGLLVPETGPLMMSESMQAYLWQAEPMLSGGFHE